MSVVYGNLSIFRSPLFEYSIQNCLNFSGDTGIATKKPITPFVLPERLQDNPNTIAVATTVPIIIILLTAGIVAGAIMYCRRRPKDENKKSLVDNDMMDTSYNQPSAATEGSVRLSKLKAYFSKPKPQINGADGDQCGIGIHNPVYEQSRDKMNEIKIETPPANPFT